MYKVEVWKSDPSRNSDVLFLSETHSTENGLSRGQCLQFAHNAIDILKEFNNVSLQIVEIDHKIIYGYDYKTGKEFK